MRTIDADAIITQLIERKKDYTRMMDDLEEQGQASRRMFELCKQLDEVNFFICMIAEAPTI